MAEVGKINPFTTVKYTTKDGEKVTATKQNGIVTIQGDKRGTIQMTVDEFVQNELLNNVPQIIQQPEKDTVQIAGENKTIETTPQAESTQKPEGQNVNTEV